MDIGRCFLRMNGDRRPLTTATSPPRPQAAAAGAAEAAGNGSYY